MILCMMKQARERLKIALPEEQPLTYRVLIETVIQREGTDPLLKWGGKLFYFDRRKCLELVNFGSKLTLFIFDLKLKEMDRLNDWISTYLYELYKDDKAATEALDVLFDRHGVFCFDKLTDQSTIGTLNGNLRSFALNGDRFYEYVQDSILQTKKINRDVNFDYVVTMKVDGKSQYIFPGEEFRKQLVERFGDGGTKGKN